MKEIDVFDATYCMGLKVILNEKHPAKKSNDCRDSIAL